MKQLDLVSESWWQAWKSEKILDLIPRPNLWKRNTQPPVVGDVVVFPRDERDKNYGEAPWRTGRIQEVNLSSDGIVRSVVIEYKNSSENKYRTTTRAVRRVAIIQHEGDLNLVEELNAMSKRANVKFHLHLMRSCRQ